MCGKLEKCVARLHDLSLLPRAYAAGLSNWFCPASVQ